MVLYIEQRDLSSTCGSNNGSTPSRDEPTVGSIGNHGSMPSRNEPTVGGIGNHGSMPSRNEPMVGSIGTLDSYPELSFFVGRLVGLTATSLRTMGAQHCQYMR